MKVQPMESMIKTCRERADETLIHLERTVLACCREHPMIVNLEYAFTSDRYAFLALEYVEGGTMSQLILNSPGKRLPFDLCKIYTVEIVLALNFMHTKGIIYRDLKVTLFPLFSDVLYLC